MTQSATSVATIATANHHCQHQHTPRSVVIMLVIVAIRIIIPIDIIVATDTGSFNISDHGVSHFLGYLTFMVSHDDHY